MNKLTQDDLVNLVRAAEEMAEIWPYASNETTFQDKCIFCDHIDNGQGQHYEDCSYAIARELLGYGWTTRVNRIPSDLPARDVGDSP